MTTEILKADEEGINKAAMLLKQGSVVGIPTETVYGLAANALDENAVRAIFTAKGRPSDNPLIVHISNMKMLYNLVSDVPDVAIKVAQRFWPGPLTMIFKKKDIIPNITSGGLDTVGIRMPADVTARLIIEKSGLPLAAPSANLSGSPSPTDSKHVYSDMNGRVPAIVDGGACGVGVESTVISFEDNSIRILRPGFVSPEDLSELGENVIIDSGVLEMLDANAVVRSPGMKYKHYSPNAQVYIVDSDFEKFSEFMKTKAEYGTYAVVFGNEPEIADVKAISYGVASEEQAHNLFDVLRRLDEIGAKNAYFRCPSRKGVGLAVYNRLLRAAAFRLITL